MFGGGAGRNMWDRPLRFEKDNYAKWDPKNRKKTANYEAAEQILINTGKMPRPLRLADVKSGSAPLKKTIVANEKERRKVAELVGVYAVSRLQARLLLSREYHPVWNHERIMVYGKLMANYLQPDANTNEPMELDLNLKFKAAFREDFDPFFPTKESQWNRQLESQGLRPDVVEGKKIEKLIKGANPANEVPENLFCEAILDNVADLGELVLQHFVCHVDRYATSPAGRRHRLDKRMQKRLSKELGMEISCEVKEAQDAELLPTYSPQQIHDAASHFQDWDTGKFPKSRHVVL